MSLLAFRKKIALLFCLCALCAYAEESPSLDLIILDIYRAATELGETDYEQLQTDLYAIHETPIDLNHTSDEELSRLPFLSPQQIDDILAYADRHPFQSLYELRLIPSLADYEIRDLLPFVKITNQQSATSNPQSNKMYAREVFHSATHEFITRLDARDIENATPDPMYVQGRYRFDYQRRVTFGVQLRRPAGGLAKDLQYNAYLQLRDIGVLHTLVAGHFQASFGHGLVLAPVFHNGKSAYVQSAGTQPSGLRYYSSPDGAGLQGAGATFRHVFNPHTRLDVSALYSLKRANDSTLHHLVGANLTLRHKRLEVQLSAIENIWSDTIRPYRNTAYNAHYFRGTNQAVLGASVRYHHGWFDAFAELATAQNYQNPQSQTTNQQSAITNSSHWGVGLLAGSRFYPVSGVSLIALYRYYSPYFDNQHGYAFSETSHLGDENGGYLGFDVTRLARWRFSGYADLFRFSGPKYGIPDYPTFGYDAMAEAQFHSQTANHQSQTTNHPSSAADHPSSLTNTSWFLLLRARARKKGDASTYSTRFQFSWTSNALSIRSTAEANLVNTQPSTADKPLTYGLTVYQDISYSPAIRRTTLSPHPLTMTFRLQFFDARDWANRIYCYENDVLYAYSSTAVYGLGGLAYICLKYNIIRNLSLYLRVSETLYQRQWAAAHNRALTRTDVHLLLRIKL